MIRVTHLSLSYDSRGIAGLHDVNFDLMDGEIVAIMGQNGSGKTTLLNILYGKLRPHQGEFQTDGKICFFSQGHLAPQKKESVQEFLINSFDENIELEKKIQLVRDMAQTFEFTFQLKQSLEELSSGQKQKVLIARELLHRPQILLLDEPFTHLDPLTRLEILENLFHYVKNQNITLLWVTHDLEGALKFSDRIGIFHFGKLIQLSSPIELITKPKNLFIAQFIGYRNFFALEFKEKKWVSPFGDIQLPPLKKKDGLLVVPDYAWIQDESGLKFHLLQSYPVRQSMEYVMEYGAQRFYMTRPSHSKLLTIGQPLFLRPNLDLCFLVEL